MSHYSEAPALRWAETIKGFCPSCRGQMMKVRYTYKDKDPCVLDTFADGDDLPYCPICGVTHHLKGKRVKVLGDVAGGPPTHLRDEGVIVGIGYDETGDRFPDDPHINVHLEAKDGRSGVTITFYPEELQLL